MNADNCLPLEDSPPEILQTLAVKWLSSFEAAARSENKQGIINLFSESALICGSQKGGPLDRAMSKHFHFEIDAARMIPHAPLILVIVQWHSISMIHGGMTRKGDATFLLCIESLPEDKKRFVAYHAHVSEIE